MTTPRAIRHHAGRRCSGIITTTTPLPASEGPLREEPPGGGPLEESPLEESSLAKESLRAAAAAASSAHGKPTPAAPPPRQAEHPALGAHGSSGSGAAGVRPPRCGYMTGQPLATHTWGWCELVAKRGASTDGFLSVASRAGGQRALCSRTVQRGAPAGYGRGARSLLSGTWQLLLSRCPRSARRLPRSPHIRMRSRLPARSSDTGGVSRDCCAAPHGSRPETAPRTAMRRPHYRTAHTCAVRRSLPRSLPTARPRERRPQGGRALARRRSRV